MVLARCRLERHFLACRAISASRNRSSVRRVGQTAHIRDLLEHGDIFGIVGHGDLPLGLVGKNRTIATLQRPPRERPPRTSLCGQGKFRPARVLACACHETAGRARHRHAVCRDRLALLRPVRRHGGLQRLVVHVPDCHRAHARLAEFHSFRLRELQREELVILHGLVGLDGDRDRLLADLARRPLERKRELQPALRRLAANHALC